MVRIQRNDAPPRPKINLVSDEENSSASSSSSHSSSSSEEEVRPTPSPLSDFIEEDDQPQPLLKSSTSSWEPVKRRRRRIGTLRRKPKLDNIDADEEDSTSTASTSSEGIPTPDVAADADDEEDYDEDPKSPLPTPPPPISRTPSKRRRRRRRRAAAPRCFLDALNKYVEPMSKEAMQYTQRAMRQILHDQSDKESQGEVSDDSSLEYIPYLPEQETEDDPAEDTADHDSRDVESSTVTVPRKREPTRSTDSYCHESSHLVHSDEENVGERAETTVTRSNEDSTFQYPPCPQSEPCRVFLDLSETDEDIAPPTDIKRKEDSLNDREERVAASPHGELVNLVETVMPIARPQKQENVVIDLCSDEEYVIPNTAEDELDDPNVEISRTPSHHTEDKHQQYSNATERKEKNPAQRNLEQSSDVDEHAGFDGNTAIMKTEASGCLRKRKAYTISVDDEIPPPSAAPHRVIMHEHNARLAVSLPQTQSPQIDSDGPVTDNLIETNVVIKSEPPPPMHTVEDDTDRNLYLRAKNCVRKGKTRK